MASGSPRHAGHRLSCRPHRPHAPALFQLLLCVAIFSSKGQPEAAPSAGTAVTTASAPASLGGRLRSGDSPGGGSGRSEAGSAQASADSNTGSAARRPSPSTRPQQAPHLGGAGAVAGRGAPGGGPQGDTLSRPRDLASRQQLPSPGQLTTLPAGSLGSPSSAYLQPVLRAGDMSTIFFLLDICGNSPAVDAATFELFAFNTTSAFSPSSVHQPNLQDYFTTCSVGLGGINANNSRVVGPVPVNCSGVLGIDASAENGDWSASSCNQGDNFGWALSATEWVVANRPSIDVTQFRHRVFILPNGSSTFWSNCAFIGRATKSAYTNLTAATGLGQPFGFVWIVGERWGQMQDYLHQVAHNYNLNHGAELLYCDCADNICQNGNATCGVYQVVSYVDTSCPLGNSTAPYCFAAPHSWQMGWAAAATALDSTTLPLGTTQVVMVPSGGRGLRASFVSVVVDYAPGGANFTLFLSYAGGGNASEYTAYTPADTGTLLVHTYADTFPLPPFALGYGTLLINITVKVAALQPGGVWVDQGPQSMFGTGVIVTCTSVNGTLATATVCIPSEIACEQSCDDGVDNDCDGLVDYDDPDCINHKCTSGGGGNGAGGGGSWGGGVAGGGSGGGIGGSGRNPYRGGLAAGSGGSVTGGGAGVSGDYAAAIAAAGMGGNGRRSSAGGGLGGVDIGLGSMSGIIGLWDGPLRTELSNVPGRVGNATPHGEAQL